MVKSSSIFPKPGIKPIRRSVAAIAQVSGYSEGNQAIEISNKLAGELSNAFAANGDIANADFSEKAAQSSQPLVLVVLASDEQPSSVAEGFLKLQLISHRLAKPHGIVLDGILPSTAQHRMD